MSVENQIFLLALIQTTLLILYYFLIKKRNIFSKIVFMLSNITFGPADDNKSKVDFTSETLT